MKTVTIFVKEFLDTGYVSRSKMNTLRIPCGHGQDLSAIAKFQICTFKYYPGIVVITKFELNTMTIFVKHVLRNFQRSQNVK